jgi:hypothetical protein
MSAAAETFIRSIRHANDLICDYVIRGDMTWDNIQFLFTTLVEGQPKPEFYKTDAFMEAFNSNNGFKHLGKLLSLWNNMRSSHFLYIKPGETLQSKTYYGSLGSLIIPLSNVCGNSSKIILHNSAHNHYHILSMKPKHVNNTDGILSTNGSWIPSSQSILYHEIILEILKNPINHHTIIVSKFWRNLYDYMWLDIPKVLWDNVEIRNCMMRDLYIKDYSSTVSLGLNDFHNYIIPLETELKTLKTLVESFVKSKPKIAVSSSRTREEDPTTTLPPTVPSSPIAHGGAGGGGGLEKVEPTLPTSTGFKSIKVIMSTKWDIREWRPILNTILRDGEAILFIGMNEYKIDSDFLVYDALKSSKPIGSIIYFNNELIICN